MGMDFQNDAGRGISFNRATWQVIFNLALEGGREPAGTVRGEVPEGCVWNGSYHSNDGQYVRPEDAKNMVEALRRDLDNLKQEWSEVVSEFIAFVGQGGFMIG